MSQSNDLQAYDVFISHSSKDFMAANALCQAFEAQGVKCWIAPRDIPPGADFAYSIDLAIQAAPAMVLVFSTHADTSEHVITEVDLAMDYKATILPVRIENTLPKMLNYRLRRRQWTDAYEGNFKDHVEEVVRRLRLVLKQGASLAPTAPQEVQAMDEVLSKALSAEKAAPEETPLEIKILSETANDARPPFELAWQAFINKVKGDSKWLLPGLGYSKYRVLFTSNGSARGENVGGAGTMYSAPKRTVEQVWVELGRGVDVTNKVVQGIIGKSAHTGFIGSIVEELRRLEAGIKSGSNVNPPEPGPENPEPDEFESVWQAFAKQVENSPNWLLDGLGWSKYRVSFASDGSARGENVNGTATVYIAPKD